MNPTSGPLGACMRRAAFAAAAAAALCACQETVHSAQWWMAHGPELQAKLAECRKYPSLNQSDANCQHANEAFATLLAAKSGAAAPAPEPAQ